LPAEYTAKVSATISGTAGTAFSAAPATVSNITDNGTATIDQTINVDNTGSVIVITKTASQQIVVTGKTLVGSATVDDGVAASTTFTITLASLEADQANSVEVTVFEVGKLPVIYTITVTTPE
jgi:predicted phage tail protein